MRMVINIKKILYNVIFFGIAIYMYSQAGLENYIFGSLSISYIFLMIITLSCIFVCYEKRCFKILYDKSALLLLSMLLIVLFNNNGNIQNGFFTYELQFMCLFFIYIFLNQNTRWTEYFIRAFFCIGMIFSIITIVTYIYPDFYFSKIYVLFPDSMKPGLLYTYNQGCMPGLTYHYSSNGCFLAFLTLLSSYLFYKKRNVVSISLLIINMIALLLTGKRAHIIFTIISIFVAYYRQNNESNTRFLKVVFILILGFISFYTLLNFIPNLDIFIDRFKNLTDSGDLTLGRGKRISEAIKLFNQSKVIGIGWDQFKYWHEVYFNEYINVHNIYIQILCENGIIFSLPFFVWIGSGFYKSFKLSKIKNPIFALCFAYNVFFILYGLTGNPIYDAPMLIPYILISAIVNKSYKENFKIIYRK